MKSLLFSYLSVFLGFCLNRTGMVFICLFCVASLSGCGGPSEDEYVAKVGDRYLLREEFESALSTIPAGLDGLEASRQFVEGWITSEVLALESERQGLSVDP